MFDFQEHRVRVVKIIDSINKIAQSGLVDDHDDDIRPIAVEMLTWAEEGDCAAFYGGAQILFLLGYLAGRRARQTTQDLSLFSDALDEM